MNRASVGGFLKDKEHEKKNNSTSVSLLVTLRKELVKMKAKN